MLFSVKAVVVVVFDVVAAAFSFAVAVVLKQFYNNFAEKNNNLPLMEQQRTKQQHQTKDTKRTAQLEPIPSRTCLLYTSPSPRDILVSRMPSSA